MRLSEKRIRSFSTEDYFKYRKEIKKFYKSKNINILRQKDFRNKEEFIHYTNRIYWSNRKENYNYLEKPWLKYKINAVQRCTNPKATKYKYYGGKGIRYLLTNKELQKLWFRDKAYNMKKPSIDRKDSNKNYTFDNCQFIEFDLNRNKK